MKTIKYLLAFSICLTTILVKAQPNSEVVSVLKKRFLNTSEYEFLFLEEELIEYCKDSTGMKNFSRIINDRKRWFKNYKVEEVNEYKLLFYMLNNRIHAVKVNDRKSTISKMFIENHLKEFKIDFAIDENLLLKLFDYKNRDIATMEECDVSISNFIFLVYNPVLYCRFF